MSNTYSYIQAKKFVKNNVKAIHKLFDLYKGLISYHINYGSLKFGPSDYDALIVIYIDHKNHEPTEKSIRFMGDLNEPTIVTKILLFLSENYSNLGVDKKLFENCYMRFLEWYVKGGEPEIISVENRQENDIINHPEHYTKGGIEVREFIDSWKLDFNSGNVIKYVVRAPYKGTELQDLKKAQNYLNHLIELKEKEEANK